MRNNVLKLICCLTLMICLSGCVDQKLKKIDNEFREYLITNYSFDLDDKYDVGRCARDCDYYGLYPLSDDLTYAIQISKTGNEYEVYYDEQALQMRTELYNYISAEKGKNFVDNYLKFYDNGDKGHVYYSGEYGDPLSYIVYYDDTIDIDSQIASDYKILKKASDIISANSEDFIGSMEVFYISDDRLKEIKWLKNLKIEVDDYINAPSFLDGDSELGTESYIYKYYLFNNHKDLGNLSFEEFKEMVNNKLESR